MKKRDMHIPVLDKWYIRLLLYYILGIVFELIISNYTFISSVGLPHNIKVGHNSIFYNEDNVLVCEINEVGFKVKNVAILYSNPTDKIVNYRIWINQYGQEEIDYEYPVKKDVINNLTRINTNCVTDCNRIKIQMNADAIIKCDIKDIVLNDTHILFNTGRYILMILICTLICLSKRFYAKESSLKLRYLLITATILSVFLVWFVCMENGKEFVFHTIEQPQSEDMNLLVEVFANHKLAFSIEPDERLIQMDNPYDYSVRLSQEIPYLFDSVYYDGKYYTYFGVAPVLLLMLPFYFITGKYIPTYTATIIFMVLFLYMLAVLYYMCIKRYVKKISGLFYILGYVTLVIASGFFSLIRGEKYDIAVACAMCCTIIAIVLMFLALKNRKYVKVQLFFAGFFTGLIVLSKPSFIVYYILVFMLLLEYLKKCKNNQNRLIGSIFYTFPLAGCAIFQMMFNYLRFGDILEFGVHYQVGANMQIYSYFSFIKVIKGFLGYLFTPFTIDIGTFPFIHISASTNIVQMNTLLIADICLGLCMLPILWILFFKNYIFTQLKDNTDIKKLVNINIAISLIDLIICIIVTSINDEYLIDIRCLLIMTCILLFTKYINEGLIRTSSKTFLTLCVITVVIMFPISLNAGRMDILLRENWINVQLKNIFEFWT